MTEKIIKLTGISIIIKIGDLIVETTEIMIEMIDIMENTRAEIMIAIGLIREEREKRIKKLMIQVRNEIILDSKNNR
jgi:hypothetical protein